MTVQGFSSFESVEVTTPRKYFDLVLSYFYSTYCCWGSANWLVVISFFTVAANCVLCCTVLMVMIGKFATTTTCSFRSLFVLLLNVWLICHCLSRYSSHWGLWCSPTHGCCCFNISVCLIWVTAHSKVSASLRSSCSFSDNFETLIPTTSLSRNISLCKSP